MKPDPKLEHALYPTDDCMMENFSENYNLCQLIREESFGWPLQDPDLDSDPFNGPSQPLDFDLSAFDSSERDGNMEWNQLWPTKNESTHIPESAWQQLAINLNSPTSKSRSSETSLTPSLTALEFPKSPLPEELDFGSAQRDDFPKVEYAQKQPYFHHQAFVESQQFSKQWDYQQAGDLGCGATYVVQQPAGPGDIITIGIYTRAERAAKIHRFRQKRERRNFSKRVLYGSRKRFADSRPRVGGRFVVNENRVIKPKTFLKRGRPRKIPLLPMMNCLAANMLLN